MTSRRIGVDGTLKQVIPVAFHAQKLLVRVEAFYPIRCRSKMNTARPTAVHADVHKLPYGSLLVGLHLVCEIGEHLNSKTVNAFGGYRATSVERSISHDITLRSRSISDAAHGCESLLI